MHTLLVVLENAEVKKTFFSCSKNFSLAALDALTSSITFPIFFVVTNLANTEQQAFLVYFVLIYLQGCAT